MTDEQRRLHVIAMYDGPLWRKKVLNMSDGQVFAIYRTHQKKLAEERLVLPTPKTVTPDTLF